MFNTSISEQIDPQNSRVLGKTMNVKALPVSDGLTVDVSYVNGNTVVLSERGPASPRFRLIVKEGNPNRHLHISHDGGLTWEFQPDCPAYVEHTLVHNGTIYRYLPGLWALTNGSWVNHNLDVWDLIGSEDKVFALTFSKLIMVLENGAWRKIPLKTGGYPFASPGLVENGRLLFLSNTSTACSWNVFETQDNGDSWTKNLVKVPGTRGLYGPTKLSDGTIILGGYNVTFHMTPQEDYIVDVPSNDILTLSTRGDKAYCETAGQTLVFDSSSRSWFPTDNTYSLSDGRQLKFSENRLSHNGEVFLDNVSAVVGPTSAGYIVQMEDKSYLLVY